MCALACKGSLVFRPPLQLHRTLLSQFRKHPTSTTHHIAFSRQAKRQARPLLSHFSARVAVSTDSSAPSSMAPSEIPPATLPGTRKNFPISSDKLIELAKKVYKSNSGVEDPSMLAEDFRFEFPVVSLAKKVWAPREPIFILLWTTSFVTTCHPFGLLRHTATASALRLKALRD